MSISAIIRFLFRYGEQKNQCFQGVSPLRVRNEPADLPFKQGVRSSNLRRVTTSSRTAYRSRRLFITKSHRSFTPSLLLSKSQPLALGCDLVWSTNPENCGIYLVAMFHVGAKSALLRRSFLPLAEKNVIRPLRCSSFPNRTRFAGLYFRKLYFEPARHGCLSHAEFVWFKMKNRY